MHYLLSETTDKPFFFNEKKEKKRKKENLKKRKEEKGRNGEENKSRCEKISGLEELNWKRNHRNKGTELKRLETL